MSELTKRLFFTVYLCVVVAMVAVVVAMVAVVVAMVTVVSGSV